MTDAPKNLLAMLVAGVGPLPPEEPLRLYAPGLRIWGMARTLAAAGHRVLLLAPRFDEGWGAEQPRLRYYLIEPAPTPSLPEPQIVERPLDEWPGLFAQLVEQYDLGAGVGSADFMNATMARSGVSIPLWMDFNGDPMAEAQMQGYAHGSDAAVTERWATMLPSLARGDRFSGCSREQCAALAGQLSSIGRLSHQHALEPIVHYMKTWHEQVAGEERPAKEQEKLLRGVRCPEDAFLVIQTGGFNTWLDVETLFAGLERAMGQDEQIHFACTGGGIEGHYTEGFERFAAAVAASPHRERFHLLGWVPLTDVARVINEGDLGLNVDHACWEGRLGSRNRLFGWVWGGLELLSTPGSELAESLAAQGVAQLVPHASPDALAGALLNAAEAHRHARSQIESYTSWRWTAAQERREVLAHSFAAEKCLQPLLSWAAAPKPASDLQYWQAEPSQRPALYEMAVRGAEDAKKQEKQAIALAHLRERLHKIEGSRWVKWALKLRGTGDLPDLGKDETL